MYFKRGTDLEKIRTALGHIPEDDFVIAEVGSEQVDCIQALRKLNNRYYLEILVKGGGPKVFDGNRILAMNHLDFRTTFKFCSLNVKTVSKDTYGGQGKTQLTVTS